MLKNFWPSCLCSTRVLYGFWSWLSLLLMLGRGTVLKFAGKNVELLPDSISSKIPLEAWKMYQNNFYNHSVFFGCEKTKNLEKRHFHGTKKIPSSKIFGHLNFALMYVTSFSCISYCSNSDFNSRLNIHLMVVQDW